jgi:hypothetical protein
MSNFNETLHVNLEKLGNLRRNKSLNIKQQGIQIIDEIIKGLSKLKTIIADEETSESEKKEKENEKFHAKYNKTINHDKSLINANKIINPHPRDYPSILPTNYTHSQSNKLLISSTTGEVIKVENKKIFNLMKNKTINQKTIDHDQSTSTIRHDEDYNRSSLTNNESLMMQIKTNQNERSKSFIANRYSESKLFQDNTETLITDLNLTGLNKTSLVEENSRTSNILYNPIENLKNTIIRGEYKLKKDNSTLINVHQNINKPGNTASRFTIDKFQYNVINENKQGRKISACDMSNHNINNHNHSVNTSCNTFNVNMKYKKEKEIAVIPGRNSRNNINTIANSFNKLKRSDFDDFANYEFID